MYERKATYGKSECFPQNCMSMIINDLFNLCMIGAEAKRNQKMKANATMFMKTKESESDKWTYATMLMKINDLIS